MRCGTVGVMAYARATTAQRLARRGQYAAWQARKEAFRRGRSWLQMYDEGVSRGLRPRGSRPVRPKGGGIWFDWCTMNLGPPRWEVEGVTVARVGFECHRKWGRDDDGAACS